ncbi:AraC-like DNA-binding protein [Povalibacter uvarum]|uniref:AraC-like DNA-binding protein n=1 Tax=Povalibacter uvarum TaxID=732238 RepID=A0A841HQQ6_9GAMM|nr:helix-turn-helix domain-containing protein [Povalibacter uvarum]MBB6094974.1 AraC-like DNA-binding protein [Povalibacter uvarum]
MATYLGCSGSFRICTGTWLSPAMWLASGVPFFFWGWTLSIMDDEFALSPLALAAAVALVGVTIVGGATSDPTWHTAIVTVHSLLGLGFVAAALVNVLRGWRQDLVEARRRLRLVILVLCGGYSMAVLIVELFLRATPASQGLLLLNAILLAALLFGLACVVLDVSPSTRSAFGWLPSTSPEVQPAPLSVRDREQELVAKLQDLMTRNGAYRDAGIAIAPLAAKLGIPEKKLRKVINGRLGFKNFPAYVNAFRLEEVRQRLSDPAQDEIPILTIALEAGFGSVVAFNRAFKERYSVTPSGYRSRRDQLSEATPT